MSKSASWCFTINNPTEADDPRNPSWADASFVKWQKEDNGTPHLQGYVEMKTRKMLSGMKKVNPRAHWEPRKGTQKAAIDYVVKTDTRVDGPWEIGVPAETQQGKRTDLDEIGKQIIAGTSLRDIAKEHPGAYMQYGKGMRDLQQQIANPYDHDGTRGIWYWGPPGTGKSRQAREENPDAYIKSQNKWWDMYDGETVVILDDLDSNVLGHHLKIWADRYSCKGEVKGSSVELTHKKFIVTSN